MGFKYFSPMVYSFYNMYCKYMLFRTVPGLRSAIENYTNLTNSTGTKYPTLYRAVRIIMSKMPNNILESGTGTSTIVLAHTILYLKSRYPNYNCKIISMESLEDYYNLAVRILPDCYKDVVEIILGSREEYSYSLFRGYIHSNIPTLNYDLVFLDGPNYDDDRGSSCCMDAIYIRLMSDVNYLYVVIDTRVTSVFMMQNIFGVNILSYFPFFRTSSFKSPRILKNPKLSSSSFHYYINGRCMLKNTFLA